MPGRAGIEFRGRPRSSTTDLRRHDWGYATLVEQDLPAALEQTPLADVDRLTVVGHSLGGLLALSAAGAGILNPTRIITAASGAAHYTSRDGALPRLQRRLITPFASAVTRTLGYFPGDKLGFGDRVLRPRLVWRWAGSIVTVAAIVMLSMMRPKTADGHYRAHTYATGTGQQANLTLDDGTRPDRPCLSSHRLGTGRLDRAPSGCRHDHAGLLPCTFPFQPAHADA